MSRLQINRRPDGVIELNRPRLRDLFLHPAQAVMLALFATWLVLVGTLTTAVIEFPQAPLGIALMLPCVALALWGAQVARSARLVTAPVDDDPPPRRVA
jgi:hypothetical protein